MRRDFDIAEGIYLVQPPHLLDLHNSFDVPGLDYSVEHRMLRLHWRRSPGDCWVAAGTPASVRIESSEVSEFRFRPRDSTMPLTEDDCASSFGCWADEDSADGVFIADPSQTPDPKWLTAMAFMSGAVLAVQAASAHARIEGQTSATHQASARLAGGTT